MNEELINQIVRRILSEPAFQALLQGDPAGNQEDKVVKPDGIVLLNYVPEFERVLKGLKLSYGADYTLSILASDQALEAKPELPEGMTWITPQDALRKSDWQKIILPACSPNTLAKAALGIRDSPINEMIGRGISQGISTTIVTEYLGFSTQTPKAYSELYEGYLKTVQSYGVIVCASIGDECTMIKKTGRAVSVAGGLIRDNGTVQSAQGPVVTQVTKTSQSYRTSLYEQRSATCEQSVLDDQKAPIREEIRFEKKFLGDKQVYDIAEGTRVIVKRGTVISPLARDTLKSRGIELRQETEEGRR